MGLDSCLSVYFENDERYADLLNGSIFGGKQIVKAGDLKHLDTRSPKQGGRVRQRDCMRRVAFGANFVILPLENQKKVDYKMPLRCMDYDTRAYERQAREVERENKKRGEAMQEAEYLSGFRKSDKLYPCATIVLFFGEMWDGSISLHEMLDFTDIPEAVRDMVQDYKINLVYIRKIDELEKYKSDLRQIFALVQCLEDRDKMKEVLEKDEAYQRMEEDAAEVIAELVNIPAAALRKEERQEGGKVDMCKALREMIEEGVEITHLKLIRNLMKNLDKTAEAAMELLEIPLEERKRYLEKLKA